MYRPTGVIVSCVTPVAADEQIDKKALRRELRHLRTCGVDRICITGSLGESNTLALEERMQVNGIVNEEIDGRVSLVAGSMQRSSAQPLRHSAELKEVGVDALRVTPID